ncbi:acetyltransferase [Aspergillus alliaceus]|uniref:acetyltransferase n=1 Tax=Petromyces alliaceus TaxID=209559 RepID=UPI0012A5BFE6|nr:acetyltransferase [Aspergillus alliaceus]KAB8229252.1 acetyltransferase [Aspergillus alliaceus]
MTAVASASMINEHESEESRADHSPSRFTAVNGKDPLVSSTPASISAVPGLANADEDSRELSEQWGKSGYDDTISRSEEQVRENGNLKDDQEDQQSQRSPSQCAISLISRNKRKRSGSDTHEDNAYSTHKSPKSPTSHPDDIADLNARPCTSNGSASSQTDHEFKNTPPAMNSKPEGSEDSRTSANTTWHEYDAQLVNQAQRAQQIDASDAQLAEALQREAQGHDAAQKNWSTVGRSTGVPAQNEQTSSLSGFPQDRSQNAVQVAPKRKRVFSNRTKTGCMTCRRRKKKCDEQHPACNNCIRGGFLCEGYSSRSTWQKPSSAKTPVPLQSKEGYTDISGQYVHDISQQHDRQQNLTEQLEAGKMRPIIVDDNDRSATQFNNSSPTGVGSNRGSWSKRSWPNTSHSTYITDHITKSDYRDVPSIHELPRESHPKADYPIVPPIRELSHGAAHGKPGVSLFQGGIDQRPALAGNMDTNSPQAQARMALSIEHQLSARTVSGEDTEKDKMIRGELYRPFDIHLVEERERCKAALWRFNNACNPVSGLSTKEQNRLLKEILVPPASAVSSPSGVASPRPTGSIGQGAVVEAPFQCHYGYNVHIGEDVMISESCLFVDDCPITIGAHTWIGPRVTILSSMAHANMQERKGSQSRYQGRPVAIEEDCYVGAGCTIYPGVRLRRGAYVAPGEVVKSDIVAYGFQGLKPSYM